jgi:cyclic pyranopterin phosphate synthase
VRRLATDRRHRGPGLTTNGSLLAAHAHALREAGLHRITVSLDALDPALFATLSGGRGASRRSPAWAAATRRLRAHQAQLRRAARRQRRERAALVERSAARATCCASSNTWTSAPATAGARHVVPAPSCAIASGALAAAPLAANYRGEVATRYRYSRMAAARVGFVQFGQRAVLRRLPPRARVGRRQSVHLPVRGAGTTCAAAARRATMTRSPACAARLARRARSLQRLRADAPPRRSAVEMYQVAAEMASEGVTHVTPRRPPAMVDVSARP